MEMNVLDYIIPPLANLLCFFSCGFIPLILFASGIAWLGREHRLFTLPSKNTAIRAFQVIAFTVLSAAILSHIVAKLGMLDNCTGFDSACENNFDMTGLPVIPDTITEFEAIIRYLLPPPMRDTCYTGNQIACGYVTYMMVSEGVWIAYLVTWIFAPIQSLTIMLIMRWKFPDERKAKRKLPD